MLKFSVVKDQLFPVVERSGPRRWLSLADLLRLEEPARISHPNAVFDTPLLQLAVALTQRQQDLRGGVKLEAIRTALTGGEPLAFDWLDAPDEAGLALFGASAFLQAPARWMEWTETPPGPIEGLLRPLRPDTSNTSTVKALRLQRDRIRCVCRACATTALFFKNSYIPPFAQYWSSAQTSDSLVVLHQVMKATAYDLCASVVANLAPDWKAESYPWDGGHEAFIKAVGAPPAAKKRYAAALMPIVRANRLGPVVGNGDCDVCGRRELPVISEYFEVGEKTLFGKFPEGDIQILRKSLGDAKYSGTKIFSNIYQQAEVFRHPSLAFVRRRSKAGPAEGEDDGGSAAPATYLAPITHTESLDDAKGMRPSWVRYADFLDPERLGTLSNIQATATVPRSRRPRIAQTLFSIVAESATNPSPRFALSETHSLFLAGATPAVQAWIAGTVSELTQAVDAIVDSLVDAASQLFKEVEIKQGRKDDGFRLKSKTSKGLNPPGTAKALASVRSGAATLWLEAFEQLIDISERLEEDDGETLELAEEVARAVAHLEEVGLKAWRDIERIEFGRPHGARELYLQVRARQEFRKSRAKRLSTSSKTMKKGQA